MCRYVVYLGPEITLSSLVTDPSNSLIHQSFDAKERVVPLNGDGFGVAWFVPEISECPAVYRSIAPAWNNRNLRELARVTRSACILAHVRAATIGMPVIETNCHPFSCGAYAFMHNGRIGNFRRVKRSLLARLSDEAFNSIQGSTDSEHIFALFMDHVREDQDGGGAGAMANAMRATVKQITDLTASAGVEAPTFLNLAVTDGQGAVVTRFTTGPHQDAETLYVQAGKQYACRDGACRMIDPESGRGAVLISSEALSDDAGWQPVPVNHMVVTGEHNTAAIEPV